MAIDFRVTSPFRDKQNRWHTQALFFECYKKIEGFKPRFTLRDTEYKGLPSMKESYLAFEDPTGYRVATELLGGWEHWKKLCSLAWFKVHLTQWEEELEVKMKCAGIRKMVEFSEGDKSIAKDATKFIINREWETKRGRPSKAEVERQTRIDSSVNEDINNDFKLLRLDEK